MCSFRWCLNLNAFPHSGHLNFRSTWESSLGWVFGWEEKTETENEEKQKPKDKINPSSKVMNYSKTENMRQLLFHLLFRGNLIPKKDFLSFVTWGRSEWQSIVCFSNRSLWLKDTLHLKQGKESDKEVRLDGEEISPDDGTFRRWEVGEDVKGRLTQLIWEGATTAWMLAMCSSREDSDRGPRNSFPQWGQRDNCSEHSVWKKEKEKEKTIKSEWKMINGGRERCIEKCSLFFCLESSYCFFFSSPFFFFFFLSLFRLVSTSIVFFFPSYSASCSFNSLVVFL